MTLQCIGSSSSGNCYIIHDESEAIILECGMRFELVERALSFNIRGVICALVSHEHLDHAAYAKQYTEHGIKVCSTKETLDAIGINKVMRTEIRPLKLYRFGSFLVLPFKTQHDAVNPIGFLIDCPDGNRIVFATDTYYIKYTFPNVNYFMMECNYTKEKLLRNVEEGVVHPAVARRIKESHMSLDKCIETLNANDLSEIKGIILLHTSRDNSSEKSVIIDKVQKATGKAVYIAEKTTKIHLL